MGLHYLMETDIYNKFKTEVKDMNKYIKHVLPQPIAEELLENYYDNYIIDTINKIFDEYDIV